MCVFGRNVCSDTRTLKEDQFGYVHDSEKLVNFQQSVLVE